MTAATARRTQGEIKGMRTPELIELEEALWELKDWAEQHKKSSELGKELKEQAASKFRKAQLVAHGFNRQGESVTAALTTEEKVKFKIGKPKGKKRAAFGNR